MHSRGPLHFVDRQTDHEMTKAGRDGIYADLSNNLGRAYEEAFNDDLDYRAMIS